MAPRNTPSSSVEALLYPVGGSHSYLTHQLRLSGRRRSQLQQDLWRQCSTSTGLTSAFQTSTLNNQLHIYNSTCVGRLRLSRNSAAPATSGPSRLTRSPTSTPPTPSVPMLSAALGSITRLPTSRFRPSVHIAIRSTVAIAYQANQTDRQVHQQRLRREWRAWDDLQVLPLRRREVLSSKLATSTPSILIAHSPLAMRPASNFNVFPQNSARPVSFRSPSVSASNTHRSNLPGYKKKKEEAFGRTCSFSWSDICLATSRHFRADVRLIRTSDAKSSADISHK